MQVGHARLLGGWRGLARTVKDNEREWQYYQQLRDSKCCLKSCSCWQLSSEKSARKTNQVHSRTFEKYNIVVSVLRLANPFAIVKMPLSHQRKLLFSLNGRDDKSQVNAQCRFCGSYPYDDCPPQPVSTTTDSSPTTTVSTSTATSTAVLTSSDTSSAPEEELQPWAFDQHFLQCQSSNKFYLDIHENITIRTRVPSCNTWWQKVGHFAVVCSVLRPVNKHE